jgi:group I intron endonuclease
MSGNVLLGANEFYNVKGEIYKITNKVNGKSYIGQTRTHRLNHGKYRPFGHLGRFKDHICEAHSTKKNQSWYLNSSLLKHGVDNFVCELLLTCEVEKLDAYETEYITKFNTKFPNGYNLTDGGQNGGNLKCEKIILDTELLVKPAAVRENVSLKRSDDTKKLISERLIEAKKSDEHRSLMMKATQNQHLSSKFEMFRNVTVDLSKIDSYIVPRRNNVLDYDFVVVRIDKVRTSFIGKLESIERTKERAKEFVRELKEWQCNQIAGNSLEPSLPLTLGNSSEELC